MTGPVSCDLPFFVLQWNNGGIQLSSEVGDHAGWIFQLDTWLGVDARYPPSIRIKQSWMLAGADAVRQSLA